MSGRGNVRRGSVWSGKCPSGNFPSGKCPSGKCPSGKCLVGKMSVGDVSVGEVSFGDMSVGELSGHLNLYRLFEFTLQVHSHVWDNFWQQRKMLFYFTLKALFVLKIFKLLS